MKYEMNRSVFLIDFYAAEKSHPNRREPDKAIQYSLGRPQQS